VSPEAVQSCGLKQDTGCQEQLNHASNYDAQGVGAKELVDYKAFEVGLPEQHHTENDTYMSRSIFQENLQNECKNKSTPRITSPSSP